MDFYFLEAQIAWNIWKYWTIQKVQNASGKNNNSKKKNNLTYFLKFKKTQFFHNSVIFWRKIKKVCQNMEFTHKDCIWSERRNNPHTYTFIRRNKHLNYYYRMISLFTILVDRIIASVFTTMGLRQDEQKKNDNNINIWHTNLCVNSYSNCKSFG